MASVFADKEKFIELASTCASIKEMVFAAGLKAAGGNNKTVHKWSKIHGVPLPKFDNSDKLLQARLVCTKWTVDTVFTENSQATRSRVKKLIKEHYLLPWVCASPGCGLTDTWLGKPLVLQLEHINGVNNDNRLENLCLLCPNCHTQTETYAGKSRKKTLVTVKRRVGREVTTDWPSIEEVLDRLQTESYTSVGASLGVSDNAVRKFLKKNNVVPPRKRG